MRPSKFTGIQGIGIKHSPSAQISREMGQFLRKILFLGNNPLTPVWNICLL